MALSIHEAASILSVRRTYRNTSSLPFVYEDAAPSGCTWEFDFQWDQESADDAPVVLVTACRLMTHSGQEYPIRLGDLDGRWLAEIESLISDEIAAENEAYWESQR